MKIRGWYVDGFGHFCDHEVADVGDGITVFRGPNEAGKSTLLAFIRAMLFGFPDRRSREARYEPLRGGRHGGRLLLEVDGESWTLHRDAGARGGAGLRVQTPRGEGSEDELRRALGGADTRLFRSVFAFSLTELQSFDTLSDEGARSRIFSAGVVGAGRAARQAIAEIGERADALYKFRGKSQVIPGLLRELGERRQATAAARRAARSYPELLSTEAACRAEQRGAAAALAEARRGARRFKELGALWPVWTDLQAAEAQHAALEAIDAFVPDAERQLAEAVSRLDAARARLAEARTAHAEGDARVAAARREVRAELAALAPDVAAHYETRDLYRSQAARLQAARVDLTQAAEAAERALGTLGEGWNAERLAAFDASLPQRDRIRTWGERLRAAEEAVRLAERDAETARREADLAAREAARANEEWRGVSAPDREQVDAADAQLRRLRGRLAERREREHECARWRAVLDERTAALQLLESQAEPGPALQGEGDGDRAADDPRQSPTDTAAQAAPNPRSSGSSRAHAPEAPNAGMPGRGSRLLVPVLVAVFGLAVAAALATVRPVHGVAVAVLAVAAGAGVWWWLRRADEATARAAAAARRAADARVAEAERAVEAERAAASARLAAAVAAVQQAAAAQARASSEQLAAVERQAVARRQAYAARIDLARRQVDEAREAFERAARDLDDARAAVAPDAAALGLTAEPTSADLDEVERTLGHRRREAERAEQLGRAAADVGRRAKAARAHADASVQRADEVRRTQADESRGWTEWATAGGIPADMTPNSALDFVPVVQQARAARDAHQKLRAAVDALAGDVGGWEERATYLLTGAGAEADGGSGGALLDALHRLHAGCQADQAARTRLASAELDLAASERSHAVAEAELERCEARWAALLTEAGARDEVHFRARMQVFAERDRLSREAGRLRRQLTGQIGEGADAAAIWAELATGAVGDWGREHERFEGEAAALEQRHEDAIRAHQDAQRRREALEASADVSRCEIEEQAIRAELDTAVDQWRTLALAKALTEDTLHEYVRTRQPAVVAHASALFAAVTNGAYPELRQDERGDGLAVVTHRRQVLGPEQLSRGTAEQLYLCLRLGLAAEFGAHGAQLPLVMDDVCVNFDPERARAIAGVLRDYAVGQQILFFTCHPGTATMLRELVPDLQVHDMPRFGVMPV